MSILNELFGRYSISDLPDITALQQYTASELRNKLEVLVIDDEELAVEEFLKRSGFRIVHKKDIDIIQDVINYPVILCDIRGVGKKFGSTKEGAFIIKEIKSCYPNKQVIAYTGSSYDPQYNDYFKQADSVINKGISIEDWVTVIDEQLQHAVDPVYQWNKMRTHLLDRGVSTAYVAKLEDSYVRAIKKKDFHDLESMVRKTDEKTAGLIMDFSSSVCAKVLLGLI